jgi:uncharacterized SAM-binding protein YcdF (DUF218 family)
MITNQVIELAKKLNEYLKMNDVLEKSDCILVLGSFDERVAERAVELYLKGYAPLLIFSGGMVNFAKDNWGESEADHFAKIALKMGVPKNDIIIENQSTNTGENIDPQSFILVQKPYMERRSYATFKKHWPDKNVLVTSPQLSFEELPSPGIPMEHIINTIVGDMQRMKIYAENGFQIFQEIPQDVWDAYEQLVALGYDKKVIKE